MLWLAPLWSLLALVSAAQTRYIIRPTPTSSITAIDGRHGLTLLGPLDNQNRGIYVVTANYSDASLAISQAKPLSSDLGYGRLDVYQAMHFATAGSP